MWHRVIRADSLAPGQAVEVTAGGRAIALFNVEGRFHATDAICTHAYARLVEGYIEDDMVECPLHGGQFHIPSGKALCAPASEPLRTYAVREEDGELAVEVGKQD